MLIAFTVSFHGLQSDFFGARISPHALIHSFRAFTSSKVFFSLVVRPKNRIPALAGIGYQNQMEKKNRPTFHVQFLLSTCVSIGQRVHSFAILHRRVYRKFDNLFRNFFRFCRYHLCHINWWFHQKFLYSNCFQFLVFFCVLACVLFFINNFQL